MINKYSPSFLLKYRLVWLAFMWFVLVPVLFYGSRMTGMEMDEKVSIYGAFVGKHLGYVYWLIGEIIPDATYSLPMLIGFIWADFALFLICLAFFFVEPPFFRKMRSMKVEQTVSDVIERAV